MKFKPLIISASGTPPSVYLSYNHDEINNIIKTRGFTFHQHDFIILPKQRHVNAQYMSVIKNMYFKYSHNKTWYMNHIFAPDVLQAMEIWYSGMYDMPVHEFLNGVFAT